MRKLTVCIILAVFFAGFGFSVVQREDLRANGTDMLLPLAPVDPRALLMGDYMTLEFAVNNDIMAELRRKHPDTRRDGHDLPQSGVAVIAKIPLRNRSGKDVENPQNTAPAFGFVRLDDGTPLAPGELPLAFNVRSRRIVSAATAFYFQEGDASAYERAQFGRLKLDANGKTLLVTLCDGNGQDIVPERLLTSGAAPEQARP